jgi:large subunit ribosomal protein L15
MKLHTLKKPKGSRKVKRIIGRGDGSGRGKCSGYGHKGAKARSGRGKGYGSGYEGGQTRSYLRYPKIRGWRNKLIRPLKMAEIRLADLNRIPEGTDVTMAVLREHGIVRKTDQVYKLLGGTEINVALHLKGARATKSVISAIEKAGGTIELIGDDKDEDKTPTPEEDTERGE